MTFLSVAGGAGTADYFALKLVVFRLKGDEHINKVHTRISEGLGKADDRPAIWVLCHPRILGFTHCNHCRTST